MICSLIVIALFKIGQLLSNVWITGSLIVCIVDQHIHQKVVTLWAAGGSSINVRLLVSKSYTNSRIQLIWTALRM